MKEQFVPYELSLKLKELGFNEPCFATYRNEACTGSPFEYNLDYHTKVQFDNNLCPKNSEYINDWISAPTYQQAFDFFREKCNIQTWISSKTNEDGSVIFIPHGRRIPDITKKGLIVDIIEYSTHKTYQDAVLTCLKKLIEITN